jgi:hypothetical protein
MGVNVAAVPEAPRGPLARIEGSSWREPALVEGPGTAWALSPRENDAYTAVFRLLAGGAAVRQAEAAFRAGGREWPAGSFLTDADAEVLAEALRGCRAVAHRVSPPGHVPVRSLRPPRTGVYRPWLASMDEGWTRFVFDTFDVPYRTVRDADLRDGRALQGLDVLLVPDLSREEIVKGSPGENGPPEEPPPAYRGGWEEEGLRAVKKFVASGGTLLTLGRAAELAVTEFDLPVDDVVSGLSPEEFSTPGALLRVRVDAEHPLGYGMPEEALFYHTTCPVLGTHLSTPGRSREVVARFVEQERVLASGWAVGTQYLERRAALLEATSGKGKVVLAAFRPQHRGQTHGTYRILFNALLDAAARPAPAAE